MAKFNADTAHLVYQQFLLERDLVPLEVSGGTAGDKLHLQFILPSTSPCLLHWGLAKRAGGTWTRAPKNCAPTNSEIFDELALRSPFTLRPDGKTAELLIDLSFPTPWRSLEFILYFPAENKYVKNRRYDFSLALPQSNMQQELPQTALDRRYPPTPKKSDEADSSASAVIEKRQNFALDTGHEIALLNREISGGREIVLITDIPVPVLLHWGFADRFRSRWLLPAENYRSADTVVFDERAVRTPFKKCDDLAEIRLFFASPTDEDSAPENMAFVLYSEDENLWHKCQNNDITTSLFAKKMDAPLADAAAQEIATQIIAAEVYKNSWTLMHRYNLARELICRAGDYLPSWQIIFVWLRYSAIRQLDWQRNYNTKPRELAGSQKSLTLTFADLWKKYPANRNWTRLLLQTVGRGGDGGQGQRIRDEILNIMHRHHLKEAHGHFIEEWHQKLHNNTTPDDIWICRAFIAFMRANGDLKVFYDTLEKAGISRDRLRNYERPIVTDPQFYGHCKDGLIADMENYLRVLLTVHGGVELESCGDRAAWRLGDNGKRIYGQVKKSANAADLSALRAEINERLRHANDDEEILDWIYFDAAVGDRLRSLYEQITAKDDPTPWLARALDNVALVNNDAEIKFCQTLWQRVENAGDDRENLLAKMAVVDRATRLVQNATGETAQALQLPADYLGKNFGAADWARKIFVEEVIRGSDWFPLARTLDLLSRQLRGKLGVGGWQIVSPANVSGRIIKVENLRDVMETVYSEPVILLTDRASGDEDAPAGCVGIFTRVAPDLVAHLSVRARNLGLLFAACLEDEDFAKLKALENKLVAAKSTPKGAIEFAEVSAINAEDALKTSPSLVGKKWRAPVKCSRWIVPASEFTREMLGGKSNNLNTLRGKLPNWIHLPSALGLPFGACEKVLDDASNSAHRKKLNLAIANAERESLKYLADARDLLLQLSAPKELREEFARQMPASGLPNVAWDSAWTAIKKVWASKWNDRAFLSRRQIGMPHSALQMAVLIQQVVNAAYAFVIHTVNPITGNRDEIFAEVVLGLGETLVGNYPGHALGFTVDKKSRAISYLSFPSKSEGLFSPSDDAVIFRSDSNGEDLAGFAGAGLYDSVLAEDPLLKPLDYSLDRLFTDKNFRDELCRKIADIGIEVEKIGASAQDIEGAITSTGDYFVVQNRPQVGATA